MPILKKISLDKDYIILPNKLCQSLKMSYEAKGLLFELLSRPENWKINKTQLERESAKRDKITRIIKELTDLKYLYLHTELDPETKQFVDRYYVASINPLDKEEFKIYIEQLNPPEPDFPPEGYSPDTAFPSEGKPLGGESPETGKHPLQNIDSLKKTDSLESTYPEAEKIASENGANGALKKEKKKAYFCEEEFFIRHKLMRCQSHGLHVQLFKDQHLLETDDPYAEKTGDFVQAARMHRVYGCQKLIKFQRKFWQLYRGDDEDSLAKKRLSFTVFISMIPSIIASINQQDRELTDPEERKFKPWESKRKAAMA